MAKTTFFRWVFSLAILGVLPAHAQPNTNLPWADDFESYDDQTPLIYGQNGWYADSPDVIVQTEVKDTGSKAVAIPIDTSLTNRFTGMLVTNVWLTMRALPVLSRSDYPSLIDTNASSIIYVTSNGFFGTWGGSPTLWNTHAQALSGQPFPPMDGTEWVTIHIGQNYATKTWTLFGDNFYLADHVPFVNPNSTGFKNFSIYTGIHTSYADNVAVSTNFPADLLAAGGDWRPDFTIIPNTTLKTDLFQGDYYTTNYTIHHTSGFLPISYYHEIPHQWEENNWVSFYPTPGLTTNAMNTVIIAYNTATMPARSAPYYATFILNATDSRFGQPARSTPQYINVELHIALRSTAQLTATRGIYSDRIRVQWAKVTGASQYDLYRNTSPNPDGAVHHITVTGSIYDDLDVEPNQPYYYWVKTRNPFTTSALSISNWGFCGMVTPAGVTATDGLHDDRVRVSWESSGALAAYQIWRNTSNDQPSATQVAVTTALSHDDVFADPGVLYYYWVRATNILGATEFSLPDSGFRAIKPPFSITASDGSHTDRVSVAWNTVNGATGYEVWRGASSDPASAVQIAATTGLAFDDSSVPPGRAFHYRIIATNRLSKSAMSAPDQGFRGMPVPTGLTASDNTFTDKVLVSWNASEGAALYEVWSALSPSLSAASKIGQTTGTSFNDTDCDVDTTYYYWVRAGSGEVFSQFSNHDSGIRRSTEPPPAPPAWVDASDGTHPLRISIRWPRTQHTATYEVWRNTINSSASATRIAVTTDDSHNDAPVVAGKTYYYWIRSVNLSGPSAFSLPDSGYALPETPVGEADLELHDFIFLPNIIASGNHPGAISMRVRNHGPASLAMPDTRVTVDFFITTNLPFSSIAARWIGDYSADLTLENGNATRIIVPRNDVELLTMPLGITGQYNVVARVRHSYPSALTDPNMQNNITMRALPVEVPAEGGGIYHVYNDFDFDGASDYAIYHQASGAWFVLGANGRVAVWNMPWGGPGHQPIAGDFNGDRYADLAVYNNGLWYVADIHGNTIAFGEKWGDFGFIPVPGDYDGDGVTDLAVYLEASGTWYITSLLKGLLAFGESWGGPGLLPAPGDYAGTGCTDLSVYGHGGNWFIQSLANKSTVAWQKSWGYYNMFPVPGDYDGDGHSDLAVYSSGNWFIRTLNGDLLAWSEPWGGPAFIPVPGDFNGDGKADLAVYHVLTGTWFVQSIDHEIITWGMSWGGPGFAPLGAANY